MKHLRTEEAWEKVRATMRDYEQADADYLLVIRAPYHLQTTREPFDDHDVSVSSTDGLDGKRWPDLPRKKIAWREFRERFSAQLGATWVTDVEHAITTLTRSGFGLTDELDEYRLDAPEHFEILERYVLPISRRPIGVRSEDAVNGDDYLWNVVNVRKEDGPAGPICRIEILLSRVLSAPRSLAEMQYFMSSAVQFRYRVSIRYSAEISSTQTLAELTEQLRSLLKDFRHVETERPANGARDADSRIREVQTLFPAPVAERVALILREWFQIRHRFDQIESDLVHQPGGLDFRATKAEIEKMLRHLRILSWHFLRLATTQIGTMIKALPI